jgi:DNA-binding XRE family transcriptional regulator
MNKKIKLEKFDHYLQEKLKDPEFKKSYEIERAKVAVAQKIAEIRQDSHLRQADLAKKMHVSQQFISQIESGQETNLTLDTLFKLAKSLGRNIKISFPKSHLKNPIFEIA